LADQVVSAEQQQIDEERRWAQEQWEAGLGGNSGS
jgi:hypothetical protein